LKAGVFPLSGWHPLRLMAIPGKGDISPVNRPYELGFIIPSSVQEADTQAVISMVQEWIESKGGAVTKVNYWGRRRLAYPIDDFREGYYVFLNMDYPPQQLVELERSLQLSDRVIRHLVVRLDE
jgi:small subunit ribosomal protein S6